MKIYSFTKKMAFFVILIGFLGQTAFAKALKDFEIDFKFPDQGVAASSGGIVKLNIPHLPDYQSGKVTYSIEALPYVIANSKAEDLVVSSDFSYGTGSGEISETIAVSALADGEYDVRIIANFKSANGHELFRSRDFSVISENGKLWFGVNSIDNAIRAKILSTLPKSNGLSSQKAPDLNGLFQDALSNRQKKIRENQKKDNNSLNLHKSQDTHNLIA